MIAKLNLASNPFRNRTTPYVLAVLLLAFAVGGALICFSWIANTQDEIAIVRGQIEEMRDEVTRLNAEGQKVQQQLSPQQRELLVAAHRLVANKTFGWSRLFADLEGVIPPSVSASRIAVQNVFREGDSVKAELDFAVLSRDYQGVMAMIDRMNNSGLFQAELRSQNLQSSQRMTYTEFTLRLIYTPAAGYAPVSATDVARSLEGGAQ